MTRPMTALLVSLALSALGAAQAATSFVQGTHYAVLMQPQRTSVPAGKIEVMEVFSYGCPHCDNFEPTMKKLRASMPANVQVVRLPASWNAPEAWPLFQRAYLTAQSLGVADKAHEEMFRAIWSTGELAVADLTTGRPRNRLPTIDDVARLYQRVAGVKSADFVAAANSFSVDAKMRAADAQIISMRVDSTPTLVVNGKYRINNQSVKSPEDVIAIVQFLVAKESAARTAPVAPAAKKP